MAKGNLGSLSIPQLLDGLKKAEAEAARYRTELERQRNLYDAAINAALQGGGRNGAPRKLKIKVKRRAGRKLVADDKVIAALKSHGKKGIASSELAKGFKLTGGQMSAILQRLAAAKKARSNHKRGRGGRWWAV